MLRVFWSVPFLREHQKDPPFFGSSPIFTDTQLGACVCVHLWAFWRFSQKAGYYYPTRLGDFRQASCWWDAYSPACFARNLREVANSILRSHRLVQNQTPHQQSISGTTQSTIYPSWFHTYYHISTHPHHCTTPPATGNPLSKSTCIIACCGERSPRQNIPNLEPQQLKRRLFQPNSYHRVAEPPYLDPIWIGTEKGHSQKDHLRIQAWSKMTTIL